MKFNSYIYYYQIDELFPEGTNLELPFLTNTKSISTPVRYNCMLIT